MVFGLKHIPILANANWKQLAIDTVWIWSVSALGGFIIGFAFSRVGVSESSYRALVAISDTNIFLLFLTTLVICLIKKRSASHVFLLVWAGWLTSLINVITQDTISLMNWAEGLLLLFPVMFLAKLIAYVFWKIWNYFNIQNT